jgi:hypothetical protein
MRRQLFLCVKVDRSLPAPLPVAERAEVAAVHTDGVVKIGGGADRAEAALVLERTAPPQPHLTPPLLKPAPARAHHSQPPRPDAELMDIVLLL